MAASVSHGFSWLGLPTKKVRVIYVVGEGVSDAHSRTAAWCGARGVDDVPDMLFATVPPNLTATEQVVWLIVTAREFDAGLIVIDTLAKSMPGVEENSAKEMGQIVSTLYEIVRETGATVLLVHHTGHSDKERARGSITLPSGVDAALALHNNMHEKAVKIWVYKQKFARSAYYLPASRLFDSPAGTAPTLVHGIDLTAPEPSESADRAADVIEVLRAAGRPMSTDGIRKGVGARLDSVRNALFALERAGLVASRVTGGKGMAVLWHLIDPTDGNQASLEVA